MESMREMHRAVSPDRRYYRRKSKDGSQLASEQQFETFGHAVQAAMELDAPLNERLAIIWDAVRTFRPKSAKAVGELVDRLKNRDAGATAPGVGDRLPNFLLPDENGRLVSLNSLLKQGPAVVSFQRGHWCPYCRVSTVSLVEVQDEVAALGAQIVAILPERRRFTTMLKTETGARFPILTDMDNGYALSLDLVMWVGPDMEKLMAEGGIDLPRYQDNSSWFLPIPATFVVGADGFIVARSVDPDYRKRMQTDELLAALRQVR
jgi:peroxiredoxin